ncbi:hypothetical protein [Undibacterium sp. WLX3042]|uniref:hypothetical protein n=1 Tax=Undibacterium sp. WLX3042 TaxID=3412686 RepID=UPI003C2FE900
MQSFKNLAEGTFDEAFAKIVHTKLYQIRLLRHNQYLSEQPGIAIGWYFLRLSCQLAGVEWVVMCRSGLQLVYQ